jgi:hypothetical protein
MVLGVAFQVSSTSQGTIFLDASRMKNLTQIVPHAICLTGPKSPHRREVELLIERTFSNCYGSRISRHYPNLLSVHGADGNVLAAVGFRCAAEEPLFLEQYLSQSVDCAASAAFGAGIKRSNIIEIGNLASDGKGASIFLFVTLAAYLQQHGFTHAVATATDTLRKAFRFLKFDLVELAAADRRALPDQGHAWGTYYERNPVVVACPISQGFGRLERFLPAQNNPDIRALFSSQGHSLAEEASIQ